MWTLHLQQHETARKMSARQLGKTFRNQSLVVTDQGQTAWSFLGFFSIDVQAAW